MYLTDTALRSTLQALSDASAPGSVLVAHYHEPYGDRQTHRLSWLFTTFWREPQIGLRSRETMREEIERAGFRVAADTGTADWARQFGAPARVAETGSG